MPEYVTAASKLGRAIAARGWTTVYGGGRVGLMGALAEAALDAGGEVIGVIPDALLKKEVAYEELTDLRVVDSMHERKALMSDLSDGVVTLPGGLGTLEEFFEMLTWAQLGFVSKPIGLLNIAGFYDGLLQHIDHAVEHRFVHEQHRSMIISDTEPDALLDKMLVYTPPKVEKWIDREST